MQEELVNSKKVMFYNFHMQQDAANVHFETKLHPCMRLVIHIPYI